MAKEVTNSGGLDMNSAGSGYAKFKVRDAVQGLANVVGYHNTWRYLQELSREYYYQRYCASCGQYKDTPKVCGCPPDRPKS